MTPKEVVDHQANLETLWSSPVDRQPSMQEVLLQYALRHLHAVIEGDKRMAAVFKSEYWDTESDL